MVTTARLGRVYIQDTPFDPRRRRHVCSGKDSESRPVWDRYRDKLGVVLQYSGALLGSRAVSVMGGLRDWFWMSISISMFKRDSHKAHDSRGPECLPQIIVLRSLGLGPEGESGLAVASLQQPPDTKIQRYKLLIGPHGTASSTSVPELPCTSRCCRSSHVPRRCHPSFFGILQQVGFGVVSSTRVWSA